MNKLASLFIACIASAALSAQTTDLVFFTDDGLKFTLVIDGDVKNAAPAARVVATGIRTESPVVMIRFEDAAIPQLKKPGYFPLGKEYTIMVTTNKKGERILRPTGEAALGTAASSEPVKPKPVGFQDDPSNGSAQQNSSTLQQDMQTESLHQTTTVTVVEEGGDAGNTEGMNMNMDVNGMGINMSVGVTDGTKGSSSTSTTTTRTTTTTTTTGGSATPVRPAPTPAPVREEAYRLPGYTGPIGCVMPLSGAEFADLKKSIESKSFEETKLTMAKQVCGDRCMTVEQVKAMMSTFSFEESKLDFAKFAYDHTHDIGSYYKVNDAFTFESSIEELDEYIKTRK